MKDVARAMIVCWQVAYQGGKLDQMTRVVTSLRASPKLLRATLALLVVGEEARYATAPERYRVLVLETLFPALDDQRFILGCPPHGDSILKGLLEELRLYASLAESVPISLALGGLILRATSEAREQAPHLVSIWLDELQAGAITARVFCVRVLRADQELARAVINYLADDNCPLGLGVRASVLRCLVGLIDFEQLRPRGDAGGRVLPTLLSDLRQWLPTADVEIAIALWELEELAAA